MMFGSLNQWLNKQTESAALEYCKNRMEVVFDSNAITANRYPFFRRNCGRILLRDSITEIVLNWAPPCVRTYNGEFLFIPATQVQELAHFGMVNSIPFVERIDVWSMILDPFLDTEHDEDYLEKYLQTLDENGVSRSEVRKMRKLVGFRMLVLTFYTWEWVYYVLYDVLSQMSVLAFTTGWSFKCFYNHAMDLANRGATTDSSPDKMLALFSTQNPDG